MGEEEITDKKKVHRERHSGRKAEKKKQKKEKNSTENESQLSAKQRNPKAFAFNSAIGAERRFRRKQDIETKRQHIPLVDRQPVEPPPILIAVVGPPKVGKTTLIHNLIKLFTKSPLTNIQGPITIVTGKKRRITLIECNNDINSMIDLAKVADLILLLCDASFGFEMEVFEFLNICQVHGMPRIMGVLTHLDLIKNSKTLKNTKKLLKHRFWTEVYPGAKLFYLSGIIHGEYLRNEIRNLGRFISIIKLRPLTWRLNHSYLLADRLEDLTSQELIRQNGKCNRNISLYGYVRGVPFRKNTSVHIAGLGDLKVQDVTFLPDPCPLPETIKKRALVEKEKFMYAPFSGVGGIVYDKDAVYVELAGSHSHQTDTNVNNNNKLQSVLLTNLIDTKQTLDNKINQAQVKIFSTSEKVTADEFIASFTHNNNQLINHNIINTMKSSIDSDLEGELDELRQQNEINVIEEKLESNGRIRRKVIFQQNDNDFIEAISKRNKDKLVHEKVSNTLKILEKNSNSKLFNSDLTVEDNDNDKDNDESEGEEIQFKNIINASSSEDESKEFNCNLDKNISVKELETSEESASEDSGNEEQLAIKWKENLAKKAKQAYFNRQNTVENLMKVVYGVYDKNKFEKLQEEKNNDHGEEIGSLFRLALDKNKQKFEEKEKLDMLESSLTDNWQEEPIDWLKPENKVRIVNCFVTGKWKESQDANVLLKLDDINDSDEDFELFGDFEDLETGEKFSGKKKPSKSNLKRSLTDNDEDEDITDELNETKKLKLNKIESKSEKQSLLEKKEKLKAQFDSEYDKKSDFYDELKATAEKQSQLNKTIFESMDDELRVKIEGFRPGMYVRIEFENVPCEFVTNFNATYPIIIGGLNIGEENIGYVNVRLKKHRWYGKILKTRDPLIISLGWRRFQTLPLFSKMEDNLKYRYLKYTPEHITCNAHFWGPVTPQGTGMLAIQNCDSRTENVKEVGFRIAATGTVQELEKSTQIMKKLKLIGYPLKIYKKTAFIKDMFNSALEVAKFEGARIKTVSGINGQIKKAINKPPGCFRATFADKIQLSDIVFCRTWYKVDVPKFYYPVTTLLLPLEEKNAWKGIRTVAQLKKDKGIKNLANLDSIYTLIEREEKPFKPLQIPRKLQSALPYRDKPKLPVRKRDLNPQAEVKRVAVVREPHEQKVAQLLHSLKVSYAHKQKQEKEAMAIRVMKHKQEVEAIQQRKINKLKKEKKIVFRAKSKQTNK